MQQQMPGESLEPATEFGNPKDVAVRKLDDLKRDFESISTSRKSVSHVCFSNYNKDSDEYDAITVSYQYISVGVIQGFEKTCHWLYDGNTKNWNYVGGIGLVTDEMFESRYDKETRETLHDFPSHVWFANDFLAFLCGEDNPAPIEDGSENLVPIGNCHWQHVYDPPMSEWEDNPPKDFRMKELVKAKVGGRQYIWRLRTEIDSFITTNSINRFTLGTWVD